MKNRKKYLFFIILLFIVLTGCNNGNEELLSEKKKLEELSKNYLEALNKNEIDKILSEMLSKEHVQKVGKTLKGLTENLHENNVKHEYIETMYVEILNDTGVITYLVKGTQDGKTQGYDATHLYFEKVNDKWAILFEFNEEHPIFEDLMSLENARLKAMEEDEKVIEKLKWIENENKKLEEKNEKNN